MFTSRLFYEWLALDGSGDVRDSPNCGGNVPLLKKVPPTIAEWRVITGCSLLPMAVVEWVKVIRRFSFSS